MKSPLYFKKKKSLILNRFHIQSHKVILICTGMSIMSVTLLFLSLQTHSPRYLFVLLSFLGLSNGLIQTNLSSKIGAITHEIVSDFYLKKS
jgi:hypothetical protein